MKKYALKSNLKNYLLYSIYKRSFIVLFRYLKLQALVKLSYTLNYINDILSVV